MMAFSKHARILASIAALFLLLGAAVYLFPKDAEAPLAATESYTSDTLGVSFMYPDTYVLDEREISINALVGTYLTLTHKGEVPPEGGEGGTAITVAVLPNTEGGSAEDLIESSIVGNPELIQGGTSYATVDGVPGIAYHATGLYESRNVLVTKGEKAYLFSVTWLTEEDAILRDFDTLIQSASFK